MSTDSRISRDFFIRDVLEVAPEIIGKNLIIRLQDKTLPHTVSLRLKHIGVMMTLLAMLRRENPFLILPPFLTYVKLMLNGIVIMSI